MEAIKNFLFTSRVNTPLKSEKIGDFFLSPLRGSFGGKRVITFHDHSRQIDASYTPAATWAKIAQKIVALALLPLALVRALIKLVSLHNPAFRSFCTTPLPPNSTVDPQLLEMHLHVHNTADYCEGLGYYPGDISAIRFTPLDLTECACSNTSAFNRFSKPRRNSLENAIVNRLVSLHPNKDAPLRLLSMGSGGLMSDFITVEKLILAGFKNIDIDCVDDVIDDKKAANINNFFAKYPKVSISLNTYKSIKDLPEDKREYAAVLAVDFDPLETPNLEGHTCTIDLTKARRRLANDGFLALGYASEDTLSGPNMEEVVVYSKQTPVISSLVASFTKDLPTQDELTIALPAPNFGQPNEFFYALALAIEKREKAYSKITISILDKEKSNFLRPSLQELFPESPVQVNLHQETAKYDLLYTGVYEEEYISKTYKALLNKTGTAYILDSSGRISREKAA